MEKELDFKGLAAILLSDWGTYVPAWCPGGKLVGREYMSGSVRGGPGDSFRVNIDTGRWADFATDEKGGDLVSLYAAGQGIKNGEAARRLADKINFKLDDAVYKPAPPDLRKIEHEIVPAPEGAIKPEMLHYKYGRPSASWCYRDFNGLPIFYEARYDTPTGKQFSPWSWSNTVGRWVQKGYPEPRPLYGLPELAGNEKPVMVVEGPKAAEAAKSIAGNAYAVLTWPNGAKAVQKADWSVLQNRKLLIWPDADEAGRKAAADIAGILIKDCPEIKVIDVSGQPEAWDAADALSDGWDYRKFVDWGKPRAKAIEKPVSIKAEAKAFAGKNGHVAAAQARVDVTVQQDSDVASGSAYAQWVELGVVVTRQGQPVCNMDSALRVLENHKDFKKKIWYDDFHRKMFTSWNGPQREWSDTDSLQLTKWMQRELALQRITDKIVSQAVLIYASDNKRNEPQEWLSSLKWDGVDRIGRFFIDCFGAYDGEYTRAVSKNFWVGIAARILRPGCKMDNMVVLEGQQGTYKSTALNLIGGEWFAEAHESATSKDFFIVLQGKMIVEISEMHTFSKADVTRIKQVISCRIDRYRAPYERHAADHPRQSVFIGTTNEKSYLKDPTGARRFWPIRCGQINRELIESGRSQFFAEAVARFKAGETWYEMPNESTTREQEERRQYDEWETVVAEYLYGKSEVHLREIADDVLKIKVGEIDRTSQQRLQSVLTSLGWENYAENVGGVLQRIWRKFG